MAGELTQEDMKEAIRVMTEAKEHEKSLRAGPRSYDEIGKYDPMKRIITLLERILAEVRKQNAIPRT